MKSLTSVLGWTLLVAVLAVPSFLFYNWWNKSRQQAVAEMPQDAAPQNIFPAQERSSAPVQQPPVQPKAQPVQAPAAQPAPGEQAPAVQPKEAPAAKPAPEPSASAQAPAPSPAQHAVSTAAAQAVQRSTAAAVSDGQKPASQYKPRTDRDPTLSPDDYQRIKDAEAARLEAERQARWAESHRPKAPDITSRLQLQGIVGNAAIINGEMYAVGQSVYGAKIVKVGTDYVIVEHKGKKYRKVIQ